MKKTLILCIATILIIGIGFSCKKETPLSDFVIGTWKSDSLLLGDKGSAKVCFSAIIKTNDTYVLTLLQGTQSYTCPATGYSVDNDKNTFTLTEPDFDPNDGVTPTDTQTFDVVTNGKSKMTWTPQVSGGAPTMIWTKQ
jgi:hypothetical protein